MPIVPVALDRLLSALAARRADSVGRVLAAAAAASTIAFGEPIHVMAPGEEARATERIAGGRGDLVAAG